MFKVGNRLSGSLLQVTNEACDLSDMRRNLKINFEARSKNTTVCFCAELDEDANEPQTINAASVAREMSHRHRLDSEEEKKKWNG